MAPVASSSADDPGPSEPYDYTEGASAVDIDQALDNTHRSRRDSQYSTYYGEDGDGAMFSGPGHSVNPSSVSRMSHIELGRRSSEGWLSRRKSIESRHSFSRRRRDSRDSQLSRQSVDRIDGQFEHDDESDLLPAEDGTSSQGRRKRRKSTSPPPRSGVFENLAHLFGRASTEDRYPSISRQSSSSHLSRRSRPSDAGSEHALDTGDEEEERWGYSSGEEEEEGDSANSLNLVHDKGSITASMEYDSEPPSPLENNQTLPLLDLDPIFGGEARIDMDTTFTLLEPPPLGPPSRQTIYIPDEDVTIRFVGYETIPWRVWLWRISCILTFGILGLLGHWFPYLWLRWVSREKAFVDSRNGFLVVEVSNHQLNCGSLSDVLSVGIQSNRLTPNQDTAIPLSFIYSFSPNVADNPWNGTTEAAKPKL